MTVLVFISKLNTVSMSDMLSIFKCIFMFTFIVMIVFMFMFVFIFVFVLPLNLLLYICVLHHSIHSLSQLRACPLRTVLLV